MEPSDINSLKGDPKNPRKISKERFAKLQDALKKFGDLGGIIKNLETGELVGGHMRVEAFKADPNAAASIQITQTYEQPTDAGTTAIGYVQVNGEPFNYREVRWTRPFQRAANLAANHAGGEDDLDLLGEVLYELSQDVDAAELLALTNIDDDDISKLLDMVGANGEDPAEDEAPAVDEQNPPVSKLGEIYQLGSHRLMCGDSTDFGAVSLLMNGQTADMVFTDPPYGVSANGGRSDTVKDKNMDAIANDELRGEDLQQFIIDALQAIPIKSGASFYVCYDQKTQHQFSNALKMIDWRQRSTIIWNKNVFGLSGFKGYRPKYELVAFGHTGEDYTWYGGLDQADVWDIPRPTEREGNHPTPKPIEIITRSLKNSSKRGDVVIDVFGGSGATLIACEELGRICYMMELDPKYVDVIRKRYAKHINQEADWQAATPCINESNVAQHDQETPKEEYLSA